MTTILNKILFPTENLSFVGKILYKKNDFSYLVSDSADKQYLVESTQVYKAGQYVLVKNGIILNAIKSKINYSHYIV